MVTENILSDIWKKCKFPRKIFAANPWTDGAGRVGRAFPKQNSCGSKHAG